MASQKIEQLEPEMIPSGTWRVTPVSDLLQDRRVQHAGWLPLPFFTALLIALWVADLRVPYESPLLLFGINFVFGTVIALFMALILTRSFLRGGSPGVLLFCCGILFWGIAGSVGAIAAMAGKGIFDPNTTVTIHNTCTWISGLCHLLGSAWSSRWTGSVGGRRYWWASGAFGLSVFVVLLLTAATLGGNVPVFFVQGHGGTLVRQLVLLSAATMYVLSALLLRQGIRNQLQAFVHWYMLGLLLVAVAAVGLLGITVVGGVMNWVVRIVQALGGTYLLAAAVVCCKGTVEAERIMGEPAGEAKQDLVFSAAMVIAATVLRMLLFSGEEERYGFMTYYPAVMFSALYGGWLPGVVATSMSVVFASYFWVDGIGFSLGDYADRTATGLFVITGTCISFGITSLLRVQQRTFEAAAEARVAGERDRAELILCRYHLSSQWARDPLLLTDTRGLITEANQATEQLYGFTRKQLLGMDIRQLYAPSVREQQFPTGGMGSMTRWWKASMWTVMGTRFPWRSPCARWLPRTRRCFSSSCGTSSSGSRRRMLFAAPTTNWRSA